MKNIREEFNIRFKDRHVAEYTKEDVDKLTREEYEIYFERIKQYRDLNNCLDYAKKEGKVEEKLEIAKEMLADGISIDIICKYTKLPPEEIQKL